MTFYFFYLKSLYPMFKISICILKILNMLLLVIFPWAQRHSERPLQISHNLKREASRLVWDFPGLLKGIFWRGGGQGKS